MVSKNSLFIKILKSIRASAVSLLSWFLGMKLYDFFSHKFSLTAIIAIVAILIHIVLECIINYIAKKTTKVTVLFGHKNKFYESDFKISKDSFVDDVAKITLRVTVEGNIANVNNKFVEIRFPSRTLFTLEADDQPGKTLDFTIDDGENILRIVLPSGTQENAKFVYIIKIKLTKNTEMINFDNGVMMYLMSHQQNGKIRSWILNKIGLELKWNKLSADAE